MNWRIYRLPGSREIWHIDSGPDTKVFNVHSYKCAADTESRDIGGNHVPRAWIEVFADELHIVNGVALFKGFICGRKQKEDVTQCAASAV